MKLWIDDVRPAPDGWEWVANFDAAVAAFLVNEVTDASFDFDLGFEMRGADKGSWDYAWIPTASGYDYDAPTGYDLIMWVTRYKKWPSVSCAVHSMNPIGHRRICAIIEKYSPYTNRMAIVYSENGHELRGVRYSRR